MTTINFNEVNWYAGRAAAAYQQEATIRQLFPNTVRVGSPAETEVQYFLEQDPLTKQQIIAIRGTDNLKNIWEDVDFIPRPNRQLGIYVHCGFDDDASLILKDLLPHLDHTKPVIITGHSLGAAISTLLMMYLADAGFQLGPSYNFGQPKLTNAAGVAKYRNLPLLRVVDENDVVPLVPPEDLLDSLHGTYEHLGPELTLLSGKYYAFMPDQQATRRSHGSFWKNLGHESISAHYMAHYQQNIVSKLTEAEEIPYAQREQYIQNN